MNRDIYDEVCVVTDEEALGTARELAEREGILCGISSGSNVAAALRLARKLGRGKRVVTVLPDTGNAISVRRCLSVRRAENGEENAAVLSRHTNGNTGSMEGKGSQWKTRHGARSIRGIKWRIEDIYPSIEAWEKELEELPSLIERVSSFRGRLARDSASFREGMACYEQMSQQLEKVFLYAKLQKDLDNASPEYQSMNERALSLLYTVQEAAAFVLPELTAVEPERLRSWVQEEGLQHYAHMVDDIIRSRAHVLPEREEQILAMASPALETMDNAFTMLDSVDLKRGEVTDEQGNRVPLTDSLYSRLRDSRDRRVRAEAFETMHNAFASMGNTIAALYAGNVRGDVFRARVRGYDSSLDAALFSDNLPPAIYTGLIEAVHEALPSYYRYLELRNGLWE